MMRRVAWACAAGGGCCAAAGAWLQRNFSPTPDDPQPPGRAAIVVGGGIAGLCTAWELLRRGWRVTLVADGQPGPSEGRNAGTLWVHKPQPLPLADFPFKLGWLRHHPAEEADPPPGGRAFSRGALADPLLWRWAVCFLWLRVAAELYGDWGRWDALWPRQNEVEAEALLQLAEAARLPRPFERTGSLFALGGAGEGQGPLAAEPLLQGGAALHGAVLSPADGEGDSAAFCAGLRSALQREGAQLVTAQADAVRLTPEGRACGVRAGERELDADFVVLCNGAGTAQLALTAGLYLPVHPVRGYGISTTPRRGAPSGPGSTYITSAGMVIGRLPPTKLRPQGEVRFTGFGEVVPSWPTPPTAALQNGLEELALCFCPDAAAHVDWEQRERWHADRPVTPDAFPLVGPTRVPGLLVNSGHSFNGWKMGALAAKVLAEGAADGWRAPRDPIAQLYDPGRFQPFRRSAPATA